MKKVLFMFVFVLGLHATAQDQSETAKTPVEVNQEGNIFNVTFYHANGAVAQEGTIKNNQLHGKWVSYDQEGQLVSIGYYKRGKRTGNWMFWNQKGMTEVTFKRNVIEKHMTWEKSTPLVANQK